MAKAIFVFEKECKNSIRLKERVEGQPPIIGTLYVRKDLLDALGWKPTDEICLDVELVGGNPNG